MNIVFLFDRIDWLGGVSRRFDRLADEFHKRGHQVTMVGLFPADNTIIPLRSPDIPSINCLPSVPLKFRTYENPVRAKVVSLAKRFAPKAADALHRKFQPDPNVVLALNEVLNELPSNLIVVSPSLLSAAHLMQTDVGKRIGIDTVLIPQWCGQFDSTTPRWLSKRLREVYARTDSFIVQTPQYIQAFQRLGWSRVTAIPNPSPVAYPSDPVTERPKQAVIVSRLHSSKGVHLALEAWSTFSKQVSGWRLDVYGDGAERQRLSEQVQRLGISSSVTFHGSHDSPIDIFKEARIHIMPSLSEGWPNVIAEANSSGTPTVAFNVSPGVEAQISHEESGFLVPKNDTDYLAKVLIDFARFESRQDGLGLAARQIAEKYGIDPIVGQWLQVMRNELRFIDLKFDADES